MPKEKQSICELIIENTKKKKQNQVLSEPLVISQDGKDVKESEEKFRQLLDAIPIMICVVTKGDIVFANETQKKKFGSHSLEVVNKKVIDLYRPEQRSKFKKRERKVLQGRGLDPYEQEYFFSDGSSIIIEFRTISIKYKGQKSFLSMGIDITDRKQVERNLINKEKELKNQSEKLHEVNTTLKVLLENLEKEKSRVEENIFSTLTQLVTPYIEKLMQSNLNDDQIFLLQVIESNLKTVTSPLAHKLSLEEPALTPSEIKVAGLVREGRTVKETAQLLNLSAETISFQRKRIRAKLGLSNKKVNLRSFLGHLHQKSGYLVSPV
jgi:PAS domain S-box-containing protein